MAKAKARAQTVLKLDSAADFICKFLDGPWAGRTVTYKRDTTKFEVSRPRVDGDDCDRFFRYEPAEVRDLAGVKETDYKMTYDGPTFIEGKHA